MKHCSPATVTHAAVLLVAKNVHFVDAPVSGGVEGVIKGSLSVMAGGNSA
jgi:3-hydroxyisobutyrate dehydrogenase